MKEVLLLFETLLLFLILVLAFYNWFYLMQARKAERKLGITFPHPLKKLLTVATVFPLLSIAIILFFFLREL